MGHYPRVLTNPGDLLEGGTSGVWQRLPAGASNTLLGGGASPAFSAAPVVSGEVMASDFKPSGLTGATAATRFVGGTASGAPTLGTFAVGDFVVDQTGKAWVCTVAGTPGTWAQLAGGGTSTLAADTDVAIASPVGGQVLGYSSALAKWVNQPVAGVAATTQTAALGADVTMTTANTYYDGPSVTLAPGTWLLLAGVALAPGSGGNIMTAKLWDGTTVAASSFGTDLTGSYIYLPVDAVVTPTTTTIYKVSVACTGTGAAMIAAAPNNSPGANATWIKAIQLSGNPVGQQAPAVRCYNSAAISIANNTPTALTFNTNRVDQGTSTAQHSTSSNTSRLTCQQAGIYQISGSIEWASNATGLRQIYIMLNGTTPLTAIQESPISGNTTQQSISTSYYLGVGDYVELIVFQSSGGALNVDVNGNYSPEFGMARIDSGPGAVQPNTKVQLDYQASTDLLTQLNPVANTWYDVATQTFSVDDVNSEVEVIVNGRIACATGTSSTGTFGTRLVIDPSGVNIIKSLGAQTTLASNYANALTGAGTISFLGLSMGMHTLKVQSSCDTTQPGGVIECKPATNALETLAIRVLERKQSVSPPSSTPAPAVKAHRATTLALTASAWTTVSMDTKDLDQGTSVPQYSTTTNQSRVTCQQAGVYEIVMKVAFDANSAGVRYAQINKNGVSLETITQLAVSAGDWTEMTVTRMESLIVGDYIEPVVLSQAALNLTQCSLSMARIDTGGTGAVYVPQVKTANYAATVTDGMLVANASGTTLTLPAASSYGGKPPFVVKNGNVTGTTVAAAGADTIDGVSAYSLVPAYASISLIADPSVGKWYVI